MHVTQAACEGSLRGACGVAAPHDEGRGCGVADAASLSGRPLVLDGDTVMLSGERIRLLGIDAPELSQMCLDAAGHGSPCGRVAAEALIARIGVSPITCVGDTRDRYGRLLATCFLGDLDVHGWLVLQGHALAYRKYSMRYVAEEAGARALKRGMWAGTFVAPWDWRRGDGACGVSAPRDEVLFFRQKDPKPGAPGRGPSGAFAPVPFVWAAELASLRQPSPPN